MGAPQPRATWLDRAVAYLAPRHGLERLRARAAFAELSRAYEGASRGARLGGWKTSSESASTVGLGELATLRHRSRYVFRNIGWAKQAVRVATNNVVGAGVVPRILAAPGAGGRGEAAKLAARNLWRRWAASGTEAHTRRRLSLYGIQRLAMRSVGVDGEVLIRRRVRRTTDGLAVPLQVEVMQADFLDESQDRELAGGGRILGGIEFDSFDQVVAYHLFRSHPGDYRRGQLESRPVPASEIIHLFDEEAPGQVRGVPLCAPALVRLRDLDETEDARVIREKVAACFAAFLVDINGEGSPLLGAGASSGSVEDEVGESLRPGMLARLQPGQDVRFGTPPVPAGFEEFSSLALRGIAAGYGITYEELTGDYSRVNFSSGRMGWLKADRQVRAWQQDVIVAGLCCRLWEWWTTAAAMVDPAIDPEAILVSWDAPRREMLDPVKETQARILGIRGGLQSLSDGIREGGRNPDEVLEELAQDADRIDELELTLDTDPRRAVAPAAGAAEDDDEEEPPAAPARANGRALHTLPGRG